MSRRLIAPALCALALGSLSMGWAGGAAAQKLSPQMPELPKPPLAKTPGSPLTVYPTRGGVYMITGAGGNVVVSVGVDGALVVDPGAVAMAPQVLAEIRRLTDMPVRFVLDTNGDPDHAGANLAVAMTGDTLEGGNTRPVAAVGSTGGAPIWAHEQVLNRLSMEAPDNGVPTDSYFVAQKDMFVNGEPVQMFSAPGHTNGDSLVMFRRSDVIAAGDIYTPDRYPVIDLAHGGSINKLVDGLNMLLRLTVPEFNEEGGTWVIPGHGRLSDEADVADYRDMVTIVRDRVQDMIRKKMTLEQVKAARPTFEYDVRYGADKGAAFVEQVYGSLTAPPVKEAK
jgi:glyoxylase-like metal-dependent hydrolase (beta-lactamase superfamily II)